MNKASFAILLMLTSVAAAPAAATDGREYAPPARPTFIAHRGVDLRSTIAGENSLEAIALARRAGFGAIETDVRLSADDTLVVMHDATLNRTCLLADSSPLSAPAAVGELTWAQLRRDYVLRADSADRRSRVPSLREYLAECSRQGLFVFIEPKLVDDSGDFYRRIIAMADQELGRGNYVITSNNRANEIIRDTLAMADVPLMGILYQTTFERIARLGNCIMAVSTSRFDAGQYAANVARARAAGMPVESHADKQKTLALATDTGVDYLSTDLLAPDLGSAGTIVAHHSLPTAAILPDSTLTLPSPLPAVGFGAIYLTATLVEGKAEVTLAGQAFKVAGPAAIRHQLLLYGPTPPALAIKALAGGAQLDNIEVTLVRY